MGGIRVNCGPQKLVFNNLWPEVHAGRGTFLMWPSNELELETPAYLNVKKNTSLIFFSFLKT
jgi:hypothetical protein